MQSAVFNISEDRAERPAGYGSGLIRPNHQGQFTAAIAPFFEGLVAPSDNQKALRLDCDLFLFRHDSLPPEVRVIRLVRD